MEYNSNIESPDRSKALLKDELKLTKVLSPSKSIAPKNFQLPLQSKTSFALNKPDRKEKSSFNRRTSS